MLPSKVQTPIFSRSASNRRASEFQASADRPTSTKTRSVPHKTIEEANLRIVQYEIAEREACKVISSMCQEGSRRLGIENTDYAIDDILSGILVLGNIYKRIGNEQTNLQGTIEKMKNDCSTLETEKNYMVRRYQYPSGTPPSHLRCHTRFLVCVTFSDRTIRKRDPAPTDGE
jgi:hypothetical protein